MDHINLKALFLLGSIILGLLPLNQTGVDDYRRPTMKTGVVLEVRPSWLDRDLLVEITLWNFTDDDISVPPIDPFTVSFETKVALGRGKTKIINPVVGSAPFRKVLEVTNLVRLPSMRGLVAIHRIPNVRPLFGKRKTFLRAELWDYYRSKRGEVEELNEVSEWTRLQ